MTIHPPIIRRRVLAFAAVVALATTACGTEPSSPTPAPAVFEGRLVVHSGRPEPNQLFAIDGRGSETPVTPPAGGLRWFAGATDGHLAGIDDEGAIVVAGGSGEAWRTVSTTDVPPDAEAADVRLPAWSPDGRLAVLFGHATDAALDGVLIVDPATDGGLWIDLAVGLGGYPPAWLDAERLAVPTRDATSDAPTITIVAVDSAGIGPVVADVRAVAASPDGSTLAALTASGTVELWRPADWLEGGLSPVLGRIEPGDGRTVEALALDATGDRLALGIVSDDGTAAGAVRVLDGKDGWALVLDRDLAAGAPVGALAFVP